MKLKVLRDIDSDKLWISHEINHGDFPFRFCIRLQYTEDWGDDAARDLGKYCVALLVVSPEAAKQTDSYTQAMQSCGASIEEMNTWGNLAEYEVLIDYGTYARLWESCGNNLGKLLKEAREQLKQADFLFGFAMDRPQNAIGATGWDAVKGDMTLTFIPKEAK